LAGCDFRIGQAVARSPNIRPQHALVQSAAKLGPVLTNEPPISKLAQAMRETLRITQLPTCSKAHLAPFTFFILRGPHFATYQAFCGFTPPC
jgi:hypothetical protein